MTRQQIAITALLFAGLPLLVEEGLAGYSGYAELVADKEARQFVDAAIPKIAADWNESVFREYAAANAVGFTDSQVKRFRTLGKLTHFYSARGDGRPTSFPAFPWSTATGFYMADIACEHGTARVAVAVGHVGGEWKIEVFNVPKASIRLK
jgi:hypothetical protein